MHPAIIGAITIAIAVDVDERRGVSGVICGVIIIAITAAVSAGIRRADDHERVITEAVVVIITPLIELAVAVIIEVVADLFCGGAIRCGVVGVAGRGLSAIERWVLILEVAGREQETANQ